MNLPFLIILFAIGAWMWKRSGVGVFNRPAWTAIMIILFFWWFIWGQLAVSDQWWIYTRNNVLGFPIGSIPIVDALYFLAGIGWHIYFGKKLKIF